MVIIATIDYFAYILENDNYGKIAVVFDIMTNIKQRIFKDCRELAIISENGKNVKTGQLSR